MVRAFYWPATTSATVVDDAPLGVLGEDEHQGLVHGGLPQQVREGGTHLVHDVAAPRADDLGLEHPVHRVLQGGLRGARNNPGGRGIAGFGEGLVGSGLQAREKETRNRKKAALHQV